MHGQESRLTRRGMLMGLGAAGAWGAAARRGRAARGSSDGEVDDNGEAIAEAVAATPIVDTHEHLPDEEERLGGQHVACDDWALLFSHYLDSDLISAGMSGEACDRFLGRELDPVAKWRLIAPYWPAVKNTGYGQAVRFALQQLYGIDELREDAIPRLQEAYLAARRPGFYREILVERARIESCQVNYLWRPFRESRQPQLLMQDISILGMHMGPDIEAYAGPAGKEVRSLADWHAVIDWWFERYGPFAVAVKTQAAYSRGVDFEQVPAEQAEPVFAKVVAAEPTSELERRRLEDHLFWYCVRRATEQSLPVKIHLGYYAGQNSMPLERVAANPAEAARLCRRAPDATFVFMHIAYPFWQDLIAVAKHYANAHLDMCWAWIIDPAASTDFLRQYLVTAPANKVLTFGGDYIPVEPVLGHAALARTGIIRALTRLVDEGWLGVADALDLVEPLLRGNARRIFRLEEKARRLAAAPWA